MRRNTMIALALAGGLAAAAAGAAGEAGRMMFDRPRGSWLAEVRADAPMEVLEERDGWKRVRIEGWIAAGDPGRGAAQAAPDGSAAPAGAATPSSANPPAAEAAPAPPVGGAPAPAVAGSPAPPAERSAAVLETRGGTTIMGTLLPREGMLPVTVGAKLVVMLIDDVEGFDAEHRAAGDKCRSRIDEQDSRVAAAQGLVDTALNSTTNFTEATRRYDAARAALNTARKERGRALAACLDEADALIDRFTVSRTPSDSAGRFEFRGVLPGAYRVVAGDRGSATPRGWAFDVRVAGEDVVTVDTAAAGTPDPYWGLH